MQQPDLNVTTGEIRLLGQQRVKDLECRVHLIVVREAGGEIDPRIQIHRGEIADSTKIVGRLRPLLQLLIGEAAAAQSLNLLRRNREDC